MRVTVCLAECRCLGAPTVLDSHGTLACVETPNHCPSFESSRRRRCERHHIRQYASLAYCPCAFRAGRQCANPHAYSTGLHHHSSLLLPYVHARSGMTGGAVAGAGKVRGHTGHGQRALRGATRQVRVRHHQERLSAHRAAEARQRPAARAAQPRLGARRVARRARGGALGGAGRRRPHRRAIRRSSRQRNRQLVRAGQHRAAVVLGT